VVPHNLLLVLLQKKAASSSPLHRGERELVPRARLQPLDFRLAAVSGGAIRARLHCDFAQLLVADTVE
jgi:hypothetical protein